MRDILDKIDNAAGAPGRLPSEEFNDHKIEHQNSVLRSGQTLNAADPLQQAKAMFVNGTAAGSFAVAGSANLVQLTPIRGINGVVLPDSYEQMDGMIFNFFKDTANDGAVAVQVGQDSGSLLGITPLTERDGATPTDIGRVQGECRIQYLHSLNAFVIIDSGYPVLTNIEKNIGVIRRTFACTDGELYGWLDPFVPSFASQKYLLLNGVTVSTAGSSQDREHYYARRSFDTTIQIFGMQREGRSQSFISISPSQSNDAFLSVILTLGAVVNQGELDG